MIVIYGIKEQLDPIKAELSTHLHACMQSVLGMPESKKAQRFVSLDRDSFFYPEGRSDRYTVIEINMMAGRKPETQKALIKAIFKRLEAELNLAPVDVEITIKEQAPYQWGFRGITGDEVKDLDYKIQVRRRSDLHTESQGQFRLESSYCRIHPTGVSATPLLFP